MSAQPKYIEQWERVQRWHTRINEFSEQEAKDVPADRFQDDIFAFFLNCYQLKDWIINDPSMAYTKKQVEKYISKSEELSLCADLCNGLKHLLPGSSRSRKNPHFGPQVHRMVVGERATTFTTGFLIESDPQCYDAVSLAEKCVRAWELFLKDPIR